MANTYPEYILTGQTPAVTYQNLVQLTVESQSLVNGYGVEIDSVLNVTTSYAVSASWPLPSSVSSNLYKDTINISPVSLALLGTLTLPSNTTQSVLITSASNGMLFTYLSFPYLGGSTGKSLSTGTTTFLTPRNYAGGGMTCSFQYLFAVDPGGIVNTYWQVSLFAASASIGAGSNYYSSNLVGSSILTSSFTSPAAGQMMNVVPTASFSDPSNYIQQWSTLTLNISRLTGSGEYSNCCDVVACRMEWITS